MDLNAFIDEHEHEWRRLEQLTRQSVRNGAEVDELLDLYSRVSTHLSLIRTSTPDPKLSAWLSAVLASARLKGGASKQSVPKAAGHYLSKTLPAALYVTSRWWVPTLLISVVLTFVAGAWLHSRPDVLAQIVPADQAQRLVNVEFAGYYREYSNSSFSTLVWVNNAWVCAVCIGLGFLGVPVIFMLVTNLFNVAVVGALMHQHGRADVFYGMLLPHGILELTAIFVAAGTGLRLFWSWVEPGRQTRLAAMASAGRTALAVAAGLVLVLAVSGLIEGFVTPSYTMPPWMKLTIGSLAEVGFLVYVFVVGRRAVRAGETGDVAAVDREAALPTAA